MNQRPTRSGGFTLVEMLVVIVITGVLSVSLVQMLQVARTSSDHNRVLTELQQNARVGIQQISDDLRHVSYGKDATQPSIYYAGPDSVVYTADIFTENPGAEQIAFFLSPDGDPETPNPDDTILMKSVRDTTGAELWSAPQAYGIARDGLAFRWFNGAGVELENPVPHPEQVGEIFASLTAVASREIRGVYPEMTLNSTIYPRNLPLTPARSRPSAPGCNALTYPDCESATLSWTTPTTNTDGTALPLSEISHFALYFGLNPNDLSLYTKLARTINAWTINGMEGGNTYYISVTCVSRSGVESYRCGHAADMTSPLVPKAPATLDVLPGPGCSLQWTAVTQFTNDETITTPVTYVIYRDVSPGFTPGPDNRLDSVRYTTSYVDTSMVSCSTNYYVVVAKACGNEGDPSPEVQKDFPAPPAAVSGLSGHPATSPGSVVLNFNPFLLRNDGTELPPDEIDSYQVYADTVPAPTRLWTTVSAPADSILITGLDPCRTWYVNLRCVDACGHEGDYVPAAAIPVLILDSCQPGVPTPPGTLALTPAQDRIELEWPTNTSDCDLFGYKIFYGPTSGGPYNGANAAEGPSPILVPAAAVVQGSVCRYALTGLDVCTPMHVVVRSVDNCSPGNESADSPEAAGTTTCIACETADACLSWTTTGPTQTEVNLEIYTLSGSGETITRLTPTYAGPALVSQVWLGRPLTKIWAADGSAGEDGAVGPRPSGTVLNVSDFTVDAWTEEWDGHPLRLVFDQDMRGVNLSLAFRGTSGLCSAAGTVTESAVFDDWNDGNYTGWTASGGSWSAATGELRQSTTSNSYILYRNSYSTTDQTIEVKTKVASGTGRSAFIVFRRQSNTNYFLFGLNTTQDRVKVAKVTSGTLSGDLASASRTLHDNTWYTLRVAVTGNRIRGWLNCEPVIDYTDATLWASGGVGVSTRQTNAYFDDIRVYSGTVLP